MAFLGFGKKKNDEPQSAKRKAPRAEVKEKASQSAVAVSNIKDVLVRPRITEKAANMGSENVYTFDIKMDATKGDVVAAVKALYKVTPRKVHVVTIPAKRVAMRKRRGFGKTAAGKKAYIFLKKGEQINIA